VSEQAAAKYIPRLFLENFARGISRTYLYELFDEAPDPAHSNNQMNWGLIRADGSEKPAFVALSNLLSELNDTAAPSVSSRLNWSLSNSDKTIHHLLLQRSDGGFDLILWREVSSYDRRAHTDIANEPSQTSLNIGPPVHTITLYEPVVQAQPLKTFDGVGSVQLQIPDHPLVLEIKLK
jgi:hypothetical protein